MTTLASAADTTHEKLHLTWAALVHPDTGSSDTTSYHLQIYNDVTQAWDDVIG